MNIYEVLRVKKKLVARNISTGVIAADGVIRAIQLRNAEKDNQNLILDPASGRITRIAKTGEQLKGKASFSEITANRDPEIMFSNLKNLTKMVAKGLQPSLVVTGMAGMGKTHVVKQTLEEAGLKESTDFVHFKGRATAAGLYITLYENSDKIIVLDDCDSVFKDDDAINILKGEKATEYGIEGKNGVILIQSKFITPPPPPSIAPPPPPATAVNVENEDDKPFCPFEPVTPNPPLPVITWYEIPRCSNNNEPDFNPPAPPPPEPGVGLMIGT